jgi:uncharacterized protein
MKIRTKDSARVMKKRVVAYKEAPTDEGVFTGYASVFNVVDSYREMVAPGAFTDSLKRIAESGWTLPALWQHKTAEPIGGYSKLVEDTTGLYVEGFLLKDDIPQARIAYKLMQKKIVTGLSIGYYVEGESWNERERILTLTKLDLVEVSVVTLPANGSARIEEVKEKIALGILPTLREMEIILREQGFSRALAAHIAERGLKSLLDQGDLGASAYGDFLKHSHEGGGFSLPTVRRG